jgi:membrane associated rhomboid family serine protease
MRIVTDKWKEAVNRFGSVTQLLIVATVVVFGLQLVCRLLRFDFGFLFALSAPGLRHGFVWQPVTYIFLHGGIFHIFVNMLMLWFFGREVEFFIGQKYFTRLYFIAGLAGAVLHVAFNWTSSAPVVGASAAVLGCVVAFATMFPDREITLLVFFVLPVRLKAKTMALIAVAFDVVALLSGMDAKVAHLAHLGGAAVGYLYVKHLGYGKPIRWPRFERKKKPIVDFISEEVDPILDKISREGMQSLTERERRILESARDVMNKRQR